jgi:hypothetical protein
VLRNMREQHNRIATAVPEGWHPHDLRNKPVTVNPEQDPPPEIVKHSAVAMIDAIVQHHGPIEQD